MTSITSVRLTVFSSKTNTFCRQLMLCSLYVCMLLSAACASAVTPKKNPPTWPQNGIAQRNFYGSSMFIEKNDKQWYVWVLSDTQRDYDKALNFFSGKSHRVTFEYGDDGSLADQFVDQKGRKHRSAKEVAHLHFDDPRPGGFVGTVGFSGERLYLGAKGAYCSPQLIVVNGVSPNEKKPWRKIPLYQDKATINCPTGRWMSLIGTSLDLGDGTFLATTEFNVFRLRMSDLSPVGVAPALHVVDADKVEATIKAAEGKTLQDPNGYLTSSLNLPNLRIPSSGQKNP